MTVVGWMVYAFAVSALLGSGAWLAEHALARVGLPTRWVWIAGLCMCIGLPILAQLNGPTTADGGGALLGATLGDVVVSPSPTVAAGEAPAGTLATIWAGVARWQGRFDGALAVGAAWARESSETAEWVVRAWAGASLAFAVAMIASMLRLGARSRAWPTETLGGRVVRLSPHLGPATIGLVRPEIVLPRWATGLGSRELELVLAHESEHVRARDPLILALGLGAVVACPWNPLLWWQHRRLRDAVEVDCDRRVIGHGASAPRYGEMLLEMGAHPGTGLVPVPTMLGSRSLLERRLAAMKKVKLRSVLPSALGSALAALGLVVVACSTEAPVGSDPQASLEEQVSEEAVDLWVQEDGYVLVDGDRHAMANVSDVVGALAAASERPLVVVIGGPEGLPYRLVSALQMELNEANVVRVLFRDDGAPSARFGSEEVEGLALVLPERGEGALVSSRNLLHLIVELSGEVAVRRGESPQTQRMQAADVEWLWRQEVRSNPWLIAAVKTHPEADYRHMLEVLGALQAAEAQRISLQELRD
jgi:biopolymer transport protein ExbD